MKFKRSGAALAVLESGDEMFGVFAFGGFDGQAISAFCEVLPLSSAGLGRAKVDHRWREVHRMNVARYAASAVVLPGGEGVAVFGGFDGSKIVSSVEVFKPDRDAACSGGIGSWTTVASMPCARMSFGVCVCTVAWLSSSEAGGTVERFSSQSMSTILQRGSGSPRGRMKVCQTCRRDGKSAWPL